MLKSHVIKLNHIIPRKNEVDTHGAPACVAPNYIDTVLAAKMCTSHLEYSFC